MGWRDFQKPTLEEKRDKRDKSHPDTEKTTLIPFIPPTSEFKGGPLSILDHLNETSQEAFQEYINLMTGPKFKMPLEQAREEASQLVLRNLRTLQIQQAAKEYRNQGWVQIYSGVLERSVYLVKDDRAAKCIPDKAIPVYLESDIESVKNLDPEVAKVLLEARLIFNGPIKVEDHAERPPKRKVDGKTIARNFYGK